MEEREVGRMEGREGKRSIYDDELQVFMECKALKEVANSLATHDKGRGRSD